MKRGSKYKVNKASAFIKLFAILYLVLLCGLGILAMLFYFNNQAFKKGAALVTHTRVVIGQTDSIVLLSQYLEWEARNYLMTGDTTSLSRYVYNRDECQSKADNLQHLVNDNKVQDANVTGLRRQLGRLIIYTDMAVESRGNVIQNSNSSATNLQQRLLFHDSIANQIRLIKSSEVRLLEIRRAQVYGTVSTTSRIFIASGVLVLSLLVATFMFILYNFRKRQAAETRLIASEKRFQTLINSTKDLAILMTNHAGFIVDWYEGAHNIKGYETKEVIGKHISIFYTPESVIAGEPEHNLKTAAKEGSIEVEGWRVKKDGTRFWADVLITAIYDSNGEVTGFTKVTRDFTSHKKIEDEIKLSLQKEKDLNEMKSNFLAIASHEFRTPLSTILSSVSLIEKYTTAETQDKRARHVDRIRTAVTEMTAILEEFLSLEKIEQGKIQFKKESLNIIDIIRDTTITFGGLLKAGQEIEHFHSGKAEVYTDGGVMKHILNNLISNAIKYSGQQSKIVVESRVDQNTLTLNVKDSGIGISPDDQRKLFERFFRASNVNTIRGTGLGLHIVKRYVDAMNGTIDLESEIGKGSIFSVKIPY